MTAFNPKHAPPADHDADHGHHDEHPPHLAHHFDTPEQQFDSAKVGMWAFLATEILMFGGLFCAYAAYRYNNPEVFRYSAEHLKWSLGATNTIILLASSLTMALAVRAAQLGQQTYLKLMLAMTLLGGVGFMVVKTVEYADKFSHGLFPGRWNVYDRAVENGEARFQEYRTHQTGAADHSELPTSGSVAPVDAGHSSAVEARVGTDAHDHGDTHENKADPADNLEGSQGESATPEPTAAEGSVPEVPSNATFALLGPEYIDPNAGTGDAAIHRPSVDANHTADAHHGHAGGGHHGPLYEDLTSKEQANLKAFFGIYYMMTGLHGVHVVIGMGLIGWTLIKSFAGTFGPSYFTPVDLVGLYWHIVDLIWIFLFPLLYLIH